MITGVNVKPCSSEVHRELVRDDRIERVSCLCEARSGQHRDLRRRCIAYLEYSDVERATAIVKDEDSTVRKALLRLEPIHDPRDTGSNGFVEHVGNGACKPRVARELDEAAPRLGIPHSRT